MRIAIDIRSLNEPLPSGVSEYTFQLVRNIIMQDNENEYLLFYNSTKKLSHIYLDEFSKLNVKLVESQWPNKFLNTLLYLFSWPKLDKLVGGADIFFMPNINFVAVSKGCKLLVTVHDLSFNLPGFYSIKSSWWHKTIRPKEIIAKADKIISVSVSTSQDLQNVYNVSGDKISVIYSGVNKNIYLGLDESKLESIKKKYNLNEHFFLYLGNIEKRKNIEGIINSWELFKNRYQSKVDMVMAGKISQSGLQSKYPDVDFIGYVPEDEKPYIYKLARAFIYPSFYEGFGLPILEAMAAGCPVITSFSSSLPEVGQDAAILVDPYNINEIANAMKIISSNWDLVSKLTTNAYRIVSELTWAKTATSTINIINSMDR